MHFAKIQVKTGWVIHIDFFKRPVYIVNIHCKLKHNIDYTDKEGLQGWTSFMGTTKEHIIPYDLD